MQLPNVKTTLRDEKRGVTYHIIAYRAVNKAEALEAIGSYLRKARKHPKRGTAVTISTIIGHNE